MLMLSQIHPAPGGKVPADVAFAQPSDVERQVRANMVSSIDGAATMEGRVGTLTGSTDQQLLAVLRSLCDILLVGAATIRAEGYGPIRALPEFTDQRRALGQLASPRLAILSRALDLDFGGAAFTEAEERPILLTTELADPDQVSTAEAVADVLVVGEESVDLARAMDLLERQGLRRVLCEGGPRVLGGLFTAGLVDELCLALSPVVVAGADPRITSAASLPEPVPMHLAAVYEADGFLFTRYARSPRA